MDPSVYDDLRTVLGNVKRNRVLQELVRITLSNQSALEQAGRPVDGRLPGAILQPASAPPPPPAARPEAAR